MWILAAKLPNSDLNFAVDVWVDFFPPVFFQGKGPQKFIKKSSAKFTWDFVRKIPLGFLQKHFFRKELSKPSTIVIARRKELSKPPDAVIARQEELNDPPDVDVA